MPREHLLVIDDSPTVLKVVEVALTKAGYLVATATRGAAGLAQAREAQIPPDVILLDSAMPGADGVETCRQLATDGRLGKIPVILMAPKGEDLTQKFAQATNVVDYITKPFSPEAIQAVVSHVVAKRTSSSTIHEDAGAKETVAQALSQTQKLEAPSAEPPWDALREALVQRLDSYRLEHGTWDFGQLVGGALDDQTLATLLAPLQSSVVSRHALPEGYALAGDLRTVALSEVLSLLQDQSHTGCLQAERGSALVELCFRDGRLDFASAVGVSDEFLLGRFAVEAGDLTPEALTLFLDARARATQKPGLFGAELVARRLITAAQLKQAMTRQTCELTYEILRWDDGVFSFRQTPELPALARDAALGISVDTLLLEGFRRVDEWRVIEREIESFDLIFVRNDAKLAEVARGQLTADEIAVLEFVNGRTSVREIIRALRMGSFDVTKILYRLLRTKLIRRRVTPIAA